MANIIDTCPRCGHDLVYIVLTSNPPIYRRQCQNCGYCAFGNLACLRCPTNPANGGDGICFCTLGGPSITY